MLTVLIGGQHYNLANAIKLRLVSNIEEDDLVALDDDSFAQLMPEQSYFAQVETELNSFAQVGQTKTFGFKWTNIHDCNWVHRRLRYN